MTYNRIPKVITFLGVAFLVWYGNTLSYIVAAGIVLFTGYCLYLQHKSEQQKSFMKKVD